MIINVFTEKCLIELLKSNNQAIKHGSIYTEDEKPVFWKIF